MKNIFEVTGKTKPHGALNLYCEDTPSLFDQSHANRMTRVLYSIASTALPDAKARTLKTPEDVGREIAASMRPQNILKGIQTSNDAKASTVLLRDQQGNPFWGPLPGLDGGNTSNQENFADFDKLHQVATRLEHRQSSLEHRQSGLEDNHNSIRDEISSLKEHVESVVKYVLDASVSNQGHASQAAPAPDDAILESLSELEGRINDLADDIKAIKSNDKSKDVTTATHDDAPASAGVIVAEYKGKTFEIDRADLQKLTRLAVVAISGVGAGEPALRWHGGNTDFSLPEKDGNAVKLTAPDFLELYRKIINKT